MHNLEQSIKEWRRTLLAAREVNAETVDELESHLRENLDQLVRSGLSEPDAFERAVAQLGGASMISSEFHKLEQPTWLPVKIVTGFGLITALAFAILLIVRLDAGRTSVLLAGHLLTVTLGYTTTFLIGALGICFVAQRSLSDFSPFQMRSLTRATLVLGGVAAGLTAIGVLLGMVWAKAEWGRYWAWDTKETGGFIVLAWQLGFFFAHQIAFHTARGVLVMSVLGNIVVGWGWFGANRLAGLHSYGTPDWPLLIAAALFNLAFFLIGLAPAGWLRLRKVS